jgi:hypothetical protein
MDLDGQQGDGDGEDGVREQHQPMQVRRARVAFACFPLAHAHPLLQSLQPVTGCVPSRARCGKHRLYKIPPAPS